MIDKIMVYILGITWTILTCLGILKAGEIYTDLARDQCICVKEVER